jgi:hypothetical protein
VPRELSALVKDIHETLEIPEDQAMLYVRALAKGRLVPAGGQEEAAAKSLSARGMLILDADGRAYLAVHPRMALSNLFRAYEDRAIRERKERRLLVDKLTLELIPLLPGESKGTNAGVPRGARTVA